MSATNVTQLRIRLQELLDKLEGFDRWMDADMRVLDGAWSRLNAVWDGVAYENFTGSWNDVHTVLQQYTRQCRQYEEFLRYRIEALERFERSQGEM